MNASYDSIPAQPAFNRFRAFWMLVKRELWEHRALRWLPLVLLGLTLVGTLATLVVPSRLDKLAQRELDHPLQFEGDLFGNRHLQVELGEVTVENLMLMAQQIPEDVRGMALAVLLFTMVKMLLFPFGVVILFYFGQALYKENRNRSMLFWKSMPLPDSQFVAAKLVTGLPVVAGLMFLTVAAAHLLVLFVLSVPALVYGINPWTLLWAPAPLLKVWGLLLMQLLHDLVWFLPGAALLLTVNAWAPRNRSLVALGGLAAIVLDNVLLSGDLILPWMGRHLVPPGIEQRGPLFTEAVSWLGEKGMAQVQGPVIFGQHGGPAAAGGPWELAAGLVLAVLLFVAATHLLRWREER